MKQDLLLIVLLFSYLSDPCIAVLALGSMSSIAVSYGEKGSVFCSLKFGGSHSTKCYGSNPGLIRATPNALPFLGLTAGRGFVCGLLFDSNRPFCWGSSNFVPMGVPLARVRNAEYTEISAGDNHLCGLRIPLSENFEFSSVVDCWGYNMSESYVLDAGILSISAGSVSNCVLFANNKRVFCWGDYHSKDLVSSIPASMKFRKICAGGFHICGILEDFHHTVFCSGRSLDPENNTVVPNSSSDIYFGKLDFDPVPKDGMVSVVGGKFNACGIRTYDGVVVCWGYSIETSTPPPSGVMLSELVAGDYFTCGRISSGKPVCWGFNVPTALQLPISPVLWTEDSCSHGFYGIINASATYGLPGSHLCLPCSASCPKEMYQISECNSTSDRHCRYNCSGCSSIECLFNCSSNKGINKVSHKCWAVQLPIIVVQMCRALLIMAAVLSVMVLYFQYKLRRCKCSKGDDNGSLNELVVENRSQSTELLIQMAPTFTYEQLEQATNGFNEDSLVGKGSFSYVYKGVLKDGTPIAVKRSIMSNDLKKCCKEFLTELDLLSRLNHVHLLSLLGYCDQGRLLVYEFMSNGSLHQYLHGKNKEFKSQLDWVKRVTIAVQASRGIEYLHGYAYPPVIHRDIKSSNILIDEEHNARVSDFGLSILCPISGGGPLSELPAGTLGYLDPEYYSFHSLTTKSDVYSFGVLLLEILSGRRAIDMKYEQGNIVEWAAPLIESNNMEEILDPVLKHPSDLEALRRVAVVAGRCVRMRGKDRPSMDRVTTALEQALAIFIGGPWDDGAPILPSEVVLGVSRLRKDSQKYTEERRIETGASWTTLSSLESSERMVPSFHESDVDWKNVEMRNDMADGDGSRRVVGEIEPASPQQHFFVQHNF